MNHRVRDEKMIEELLNKLNSEKLHFLEEARTLKQLSGCGLTQNEMAKILLMSQATVGNKVRLLNLPSEIQDIIKDRGLSERHARALLYVNNKNKQLKILQQVVALKLTVKETEELVYYETLPRSKEEARKKNEVNSMIGTIKCSIEKLKSAGIRSVAKQFTKAEYIDVVVRIYK